MAAIFVTKSTITHVSGDSAHVRTLALSRFHSSSEEDHQQNPVVEPFGSWELADQEKTARNFRLKSLTPEKNIHEKLIFVMSKKVQIFSFSDSSGQESLTPSKNPKDIFMSNGEELYDFVYQKNANSTFYIYFASYSPSSQDYRLTSALLDPAKLGDKSPESAFGEPRTLRSFHSKLIIRDTGIAQESKIPLRSSYASDKFFCDDEKVGVFLLKNGDNLRYEYNMLYLSQPLD